MVGVVVGEPGLQNDGGGLGIEAPLVLEPGVALAAQLGLGSTGSIAFVGQFDGETKTPIELTGEALAAGCKFVFATRPAISSMARQADDKAHGMPLVDKLADGGKAAVVRGFGNGSQCASRAKQGFADGNADALLAEIKSHHGF